MRRWVNKPVAVAALSLLAVAGTGALGAPASSGAPAASARPAGAEAPPPGGGNGPPPGSGYGVSPTPTGPPLKPPPSTAPPPPTPPSTTVPGQPPTTTAPQPPTTGPNANQAVPRTTFVGPYFDNSSIHDTVECVPGGMSTPADYGRLWANRASDWKGGDLGAATRLSDGRVVWILGDNMNGTVDGVGRWGPKYSPGRLQFNRNGIAVQGGAWGQNCLEFLTGYPGWIAVTGTDTSELYWPFSVYEAPGHQLYALLGRYQVNATPGANLSAYQFSNTDIALLDWNTLKPKAIFRTGLGRPWMSAQKGPDGYTYLFGSWVPPGASVTDGPSVYLARTTDANFYDPTKWQFWHGFGGWVTGDEGVDGTPIVAGAAGWPSPWWDGSQWHLAYKAYESFGTNLVEQTTTSREPNGQFHQAGSVVTPPPPAWADDQPGWMYTVLVQPQVQVGGGHLVMWSTNNMVPPGNDTAWYPFLVGPEFVGWQPGSAPHWGGGASFSPGFSPLRVALLPGRVLAYTSLVRSIAQNANAASLGTPGGPSITSMLTSALSSFESQVWAYPVIRLYDALFLRTPDVGGYDFWVGHARTDMSMSTIANDFASSDEFRKRYGSLNNRQFVDLLYRNVFNRQADANGEAYWTGQLDTGRMTRGQVVLAFSDSAEYRQRFGPRTQIELTYFVLLRRAPDSAGLSGWTQYLDSGGSLAGMVSGILNSPEFVGTVYPGVSRP